MRTIQPKTLEIPGAKLNAERKLLGKNFRKFGYTHARLSPFQEILENAVPFATGSCRKFKPDVLIEWKEPLICNKGNIYLATKAIMALDRNQPYLKGWRLVHLPTVFST